MFLLSDARMFKIVDSRTQMICDVCRELSETEIQSVHSCQSDPKGDLVTWQSSRWTLAAASNQNIAVARVITVWTVETL